MIYAVGIVVNTWIVEYDMRITWAVALGAAAVICLTPIAKAVASRASDKV